MSLSDSEYIFTVFSRPSYFRFAKIKGIKISLTTESVIYPVKFIPAAFASFRHSILS